jgi:hypothetical protein
VSVKFADKPCSERMAIVPSCQVQMIKNLEVVGAFSNLIIIIIIIII